MSSGDIEGLDFEPEDPQAIIRGAFTDRQDRLIKAIRRLFEAQGLDFDFYPMNKREFDEAINVSYIIGYITGRRDNGTFAASAGIPDPAETGASVDFLDERS